MILSFLRRLLHAKSIAMHEPNNHRKQTAATHKIFLLEW